MYKDNQLKFLHYISGQPYLWEMIESCTFLSDPYQITIKHYDSNDISGMGSAKSIVCARIIGSGKESHLINGIQALFVKLTQDEIKHLEKPHVPRFTQGRK
jgi:RIO-like serine/threonine protein kinase